MSNTTQIRKNIKKFLDDNNNDFTSWLIDHRAKQENKKNILNSQLKRFQKKFDKFQEFKRFVYLVKDKYTSDEYFGRHRNMNRECPYTLYYFLYDYSLFAGVECNANEYYIYSNTFTDDLRKVNGFIIHKMGGQGSSSFKIFQMQESIGD
jgi:hypothetical protein